MGFPWIFHVWFIPLSTKTHFESDVVYSTFDKICGLFHFRKTTHKDGWLALESPAERARPTGANKMQKKEAILSKNDDFGKLSKFLENKKNCQNTKK